MTEPHLDVLHAYLEPMIAAVIAFVGEHRDLAGPIAFVFALFETFAILSIIIPSTAILIGVGALVATGAVDFWPLWLGGALGSVAGSVLSYGLGRRYGPAMLSVWPLRNHPTLVEGATRAFARWGIATILIGHFVGPLRAVVFLMAGISRMHFPLFLAVDVVGAMLWAWIIPKSGELGGDALGWLWRAIAG